MNEKEIIIVPPEKNKSFRADFDYKNKFKASFIENKPTVVLSLIHI